MISTIPFLVLVFKIKLDCQVRLVKVTRKKKLSLFPHNFLPIISIFFRYCLVLKTLINIRYQIKIFKGRMSDLLSFIKKRKKNQMIIKPTPNSQF